MNISTLVGVFFIILSFFVSSGRDNATFWDGCAGVSQVKSIAQFMGGQTDDAIQTQKNFLNQMVGVSQAKSLYYVLKKDYKAAKRTQKIFYDEMVEPLIDSTPVIGHIKACIHLMLGDKDRGLDVLKDASRSTAIFIGAGVSGPAAAYAAGVLADAVLTGIDSYKAKEYAPYGILDYLQNFKHLSNSEHFDMLADMAFIGESGLLYNNYRKTQSKKPFTRVPSELPRYVLAKALPKDTPPKKWYRKKLGGGSRAKRKKLNEKLQKLSTSKNKKI